MATNTREINRRWAAVAAFALSWAAALLIVVGVTTPILSIDPGAKNSLLERLFEILFGESFEKRSASVVRGISQLFEHGEWQIGLVILCFSVVLPFIKVSILLASSCAVYGGWTRSIANGVHGLRHRIYWHVAPAYTALLTHVRRIFNSDPRLNIAMLPESVRVFGLECLALVKVMIPKSKLEWLEVLGPWSMADVFVVSLLVTTFKEFPGGTRLNAEYGYWVFLASVILSMISVAMLKLRVQVNDSVAREATAQRPSWMHLCYSLPLFFLIIGAVLSVWADCVPRSVKIIPIPSPTAPLHEIEIRKVVGGPTALEMWLSYFGCTFLTIALIAVFFLVVIRRRDVIESLDNVNDGNCSRFAGAIWHDTVW